MLTISIQCSTGYLGMTSAILGADYVVCSDLVRSLVNDLGGKGRKSTTKD